MFISAHSIVQNLTWSVIQFKIVGLCVAQVSWSMEWVALNVIQELYKLLYNLLYNLPQLLEHSRCPA